MPNRKYIVRLSCDERKHLQDLLSKGRTQAYRIRHAHILMKADADGPCWGDEAIAQAFSCHRRTAEGIRKRFVVQGLDAALDPKTMFVIAYCARGSARKRTITLSAKRKDANPITMNRTSVR